MGRARIPTLVAIAAAVIGLAASAASFYDLLGPAPAFCAEAGCATVQHSAWAHPLGIPMPVLGLLFFAAALGLSLIRAPRLRLVLALGGAAWASFLIILQATVIGAWCKLCLVADPAAILYALAVVGGATTVRPSWPRAFASFAAAGAVLSVLALWVRAPAPPSLPPGTPAFVQRAQVHDKLTIVEVLDFECPFCRQLQAQIGEAVRRAGVDVAVVRKMLPLPRHAHALPAALAYCCAEAQGKGDAMAHALFTAPPETLTPEGCEQLAVSIGCDRAQYRRDLPLAVGRVACESIDARAAGVTSLPTIFIGGEKIVGAAKSTDELVAMIRAAAR
ncbi:MAG: vitamin K epoxide reductase family protein [Kofleriaceae bacterium]|nr:vitamin K epoxide reductase family protein [Kofleriaceae bacterium]